MKKFFLIIILAIFSTVPSYSAHIYLEKEYQNQWCRVNNGQTEVILNDKTRIDCLTQTHAIEFDFASKWAESIGQSLYYALETSKQPGVVLILESPQKDLKYLERLNEVAKKYNIKVWTMTPQNMYPQRNCKK